MINTCYKMDILEIDGDPKWFRKMILDIVKLLGATEAWYVSEYSIDAIFDDPNSSYDKFLNKIKDEWEDHVIEYHDEMENAASFVHDSFAGFTQLDEILVID